MEKKLSLHKLSGSAHLWTREKAKALRKDIDKTLEGLAAGDSLVLDLGGIEVFDYSFANELFGKTILSLSKEYANRFFIVENLNEYTRENLDKALETLNLIMIERKKGTLQLIGKVHPADSQTFDVIKESSKPVTAIELKEKLGINLTAVNERLNKLTEMTLVMRETSVSQAGRQQYMYMAPK
jgi:response regulator of citrate/malate metabolism